MDGCVFYLTLYLNIQHLKFTCYHSVSIQALHNEIKKPLQIITARLLVTSRPQLTDLAESPSDAWRRREPRISPV